jgi:hypothetical protein
MKLQISTDLYNSSLVHVNESAVVGQVAEVDVITVDRLVTQKKVAGRGLFKADVQYAEHLIVAGGTQFLSTQVDVVVLELTLARVSPETRTFAEMLCLMSELGFEYFDDVGDWRDPGTGRLEQKDALFVRKGAFVKA